MLEFLSENHDKFAVVKVTGKLTVKDYTQIIIPQFDNLIAAHGKLNVVVQMDSEFKGWEIGAFWTDIQYGLKHRHAVNKIALVTSLTWIKSLACMAKLVVSGEVKVFPETELQAAFTWMNENL